MKALLIGLIHESAKKQLMEKCEVSQISQEQFDCAKKFNDVEIVVVRTYTKLGKQELQNFPALRFVVSCSVGIDNIDIEELKKRSIELIACVGTNANSVAEHTIFLLLSLIRNNQKLPFVELRNKTVGIIGFGAIGKSVAKKLIGFEAKVVAFDVIPQDAKVLKDLKTEMMPLQVVVKSDIVTVHVPLNKLTEKMMNDSLFAQMKKGSFFINTSRAEVVDEAALLQCIKKDHFRGVGLDVYSSQLAKKLPKGKNIVLTPHIAARGEDSFREMCESPIKELMKKLG